MLNALDERLRPTLEGTPELDEFRTYFNGVKLEKGQSLRCDSQALKPNQASSSRTIWNQLKVLWCF